MKRSLTLDDLFPHDNALVRVACGPDGEPAHIDDVTRGRACGCACFQCKLPLVARQGKKLQWSFAHYGDPDGNKRCAAATETALHAVAKVFVARRGEIMVPGVVVSDELGPLQFTEDRIVKFTKVELELREGQVVPDIVGTYLTKGGVTRRIFIEIANFHKCPPKKLEKLLTMDVAVMEIDVSGFRSLPLEELEDVIVSSAPRKLIQAVTIQKAAEALAGRKAEHERQRAERLTPMVALFYKDDPAAVMASEIQELDDIRGTPLEALLGGDIKQPSCFSAPPKLWQGALIFKLMASHDFSPAQWIVDIANAAGREVIKPGLRYLKAEDAKWIRENLEPTFRSMFEEAEDFMGDLVVKGMAHVSHRKGRWYPASALKAHWEKVSAKKRLIAKRREWLADMREKILNKADIGCFDKDGFEFDAWLAGRAASRRIGVDVMLSDTGAVWDLFEANLVFLYKMMGSKTLAVGPDYEGLPVERFFEPIRADRQKWENFGARVREQKWH